jgi:HEAT repeat protein
MSLALILSLFLADGKDEEIKELLKELKSNADSRRISACGQLAKLGTEAKELASKSLCQTATDKSAKVREAALEALEKVNPDLYPHAVVVVAHDRLKTAESLAAIKKLGDDALDFMPILLFALKRVTTNDRNRMFQDGSFRESSDREEFRNIVAALAAVDGNDVETVRLICGLFKATHGEQERKAILDAIRVIAADQDQMRKHLISTLKTALQDENTILAAVPICGICGQEAKELIPLLKKFKLSRSEELRKAAAKAIEEIESDGK